MTDTGFSCISICPNGIGVRDAQGHINLRPRTFNDETQGLPDLSLVATPPHCIYLPIEDLLVRHFNLPLQHTRFLDANMLAQELADTAGIEPEDWWLSWQAGMGEQGVSGLVFGLPQAQKQVMQQDNTWQAAPFLLVDAWQRLTHRLAQHDADTAAVLDADAEGIFLGFCQRGVWQGMRRLNADMHDAEACARVGNEAMLSLQAMGFNAEEHPLLGLVSPAMQAIEPYAAHQLGTADLHPRHIATLKLPAPQKADNTLNIRHGSWSAQRHASIPKAWRRTVALGGMLVALWLIGLGVQNHRLEQRIQAMNDAIIAAFHRGLPEQTVIIDAMAQLEQAAGQGGASPQSKRISATLNGISQAFQKHPWRMQELRISGDEVVMSGKVDSLDTLNNINNALRQALGRDVKITDTDLQGNEVSFRIRWS